ncbi:WD40-repeat-containing domain protein [Mycena crocata]|nr:WD40-repeat-containing domain protein [Mycena crocata]
MATYSLEKTLVPNPPGKAGAINSVLFFENGSMLASGGDDQCLRIWDLTSGQCVQELKDPLWGQILDLKLLEGSGNGSATIFIGTARGFVVTYLWLPGQRRFNKQNKNVTAVFKLDDSVEIQALDSSNFRLAVGSHAGHITLYSIENHITLNSVWTRQLQSYIPRSIFFWGECSDQLLVHTLNPGPAFCLDVQTGQHKTEFQVHGDGVGAVALCPNRRIKAIHNAWTDTIELYRPSSSITPVSLPINSNSGRIKGVAFAEGGDTLVCGGDDGYVTVYDLVGGIQPHDLIHTSDCNPVCALATCATEDYHLIASGGSEFPATIYVWLKPTESKLAEDRRISKEREENAAFAEKAAIEAAKLAADTEAFEKDRKTRQQTLARLNATREAYHVWGGFILLALFALAVFLYIEES